MPVGRRRMPTENHSNSLMMSFTQANVKSSSASEGVEDSSSEQDEVEESEVSSITTSGCGVGTRWSAGERSGKRGILPRELAAG